MAGHRRKNLIDGLSPSTSERVFGIAISAPQWTPRQTNKDRGQAAELGLALYREENLGDFQPFGSLILVKSGCHTQPCSCVNRSSR